MRRLLATVRCDAQVQLRAGFYYAAAVLVAVWALLRAFVPGVAQAWLVPALVLNNLAITGFYFAGGLVLLERTHGTLRAQSVTPLAPDEYVAAKLITLGGLALAQSLASALILVGPSFAALPLAAGTLLAAAIFGLVGLWAVARYESFNAYLIPSTLYVGPLLLPLVPYVWGWAGWPLFLHPVQPAIVLMRAAFEPTAPALLAYAAIAGLLWAGVAYRLGRGAFTRLVSAAEGGV